VTKQTSQENVTRTNELKKNLQGRNNSSNKSQSFATIPWNTTCHKLQTQNKHRNKTLILCRSTLNGCWIKVIPSQK